MNKNILIILTLIIAIFIGILVWQLQLRERFSESSFLSRNDKNIEEKNDFINWQTFKNEEFRFQVKYPEDYLIGRAEASLNPEWIIAHNKWKDELVARPYVSISVVYTHSLVDEYARQQIEKEKEQGSGLFEEGCIMHCVSSAPEEVKIGSDIRALRYAVWGVSGGGEYFITQKETVSDWLVVIYNHVAGARDSSEERLPKDVIDKILDTFLFLD